ncbi:hypothetical protein E2I00_007311, partial [Balaenoptera physalus]
VTTTAVTPTPEQAKSVRHFSQANSKIVSTFLIFLNSENEACLGTPIHKQWHDIMLIKLTDPLKLNDQVKLVVLPSTTTDRRLDNCTVFGWGWSWKNSICSGTLFWGPHISLNPIQFPVYIQEEIKEVAAVPILCQYQLQGILSWSEGCILRGDVGYYTKASHYTDWILKVINTY